MYRERRDAGRPVHAGLLGVLHARDAVTESPYFSVGTVTIAGELREEPANWSGPCCDGPRQAPDNLLGPMDSEVSEPGKLLVAQDGGNISISNGEVAASIRRGYIINSVLMMPYGEDSKRWVGGGSLTGIWMAST